MPDLLDYDAATVDVVRDGRSSGSVAKVLLANNFDAGALRPFEDEHGRSWVTLRDGFNADGTPKFKNKRLANNASTLRVEEWRVIDEAVVQTARIELRLVRDLIAAGLRRDIEGLGTPVISYQTQSDITDAKISMNATRTAERDRPVFDIVNMPIPIIHKDTSIDIRELAMGRRTGREIDTTMAEAMTRKVAEKAEALAVGNVSFSYAGGTVYGLRNFPNRITKTMTNPTSGTWTPSLFLDEVLDMRQQLRGKFRNGPYRVYYSTDWDPYLDADYSGAYGNLTPRERVSKVANITDWVPLEILTGYQVIMVQMTKDVIQIVIGMDIKPVEWQSPDGMEHFIKIMGIIVPQIRVDQASNCGIAHGTAP